MARGGEEIKEKRYRQKEERKERMRARCLSGPSRIILPSCVIGHRFDLRLFSYVAGRGDGKKSEMGERETTRGCYCVCGRKARIYRLPRCFTGDENERREREEGQRRPSDD